MANESFPQEPTVDQFISESRFENSRTPGQHAGTRLRDGWAGGSLEDLVRHADTPRGTPSGVEP